MIAPVVEQAAREAGETAKFFEVDTDQAPDLAARLGILSIPTLVFFHKGKEIGRTVGSTTKAKILDKVKTLN